MFKNVSAFLISLICGILIIVLFFVNFNQRLHQPRYRLPGREYAVQINNNAPQYYVFGKDRNQGRVIVTSDKETANQASKSVPKFNKLWELQSNAGDQVYYTTDHHSFHVAHSANTMANFAGTGAKVDGKTVHASFDNQQTGSVKATMVQVHHNHPMRAK